MKRHNVREVTLNGEELQIRDSFNEYLSRGFTIMEAAFFSLAFYVEDHAAATSGYSLDPAFVMYLSDNELTWDPRAAQILDRKTRLPLWGLSSNGARVRETITHLSGAECSLALLLGKEDGTIYFHEWMGEPDEVNCPDCATN